MQRNGAQIVLETLIEQGVTDVFGLPRRAGAQHLRRLLRIQRPHPPHTGSARAGRRARRRRLCARHRQGGRGHRHVRPRRDEPRHRHRHPAMLDSVPLVAITGNVALEQIGRDAFQEVDITGITLHITKHNYFVNDVTRLADTIREAFRIARSGRPGPVLIDIPKGCAGRKPANLSPSRWNRPFPSAKAPQNRHRRGGRASPRSANGRTSTSAAASTPPR